MASTVRAAAAGALALCGAALVLPPAAFAQLSSGGGPIRVNAAESSVLERERKVIVIGDVDIIQGEARLRADQVTLFYSGDGDARATAGVGAGFGDIERMEAEGEVFYVTPEFKARGDQGNYEAATDTITLTGEVVLIRGCDVARGTQLVINVAEQTSTLSGGDGRGVQLIIETDEDQTGETPDDCA